MSDVRVFVEADIASGSGLGTSSALVVALVKAIHNLREEKVDYKQIANEAIFVERVVCEEAGGVQDQWAVAIGGMNSFNFSKNGMSRKSLSDHIKFIENGLFLVPTNLHRKSSDIQEKFKHFIKNNEDKMCMLDSLKNMTVMMEKTLLSQDYHKFCMMLSTSWALKKAINRSATTTEINEMYRKLLKKGASSAKLLGAGAGGYFLCYVKKENVQRFKSAFVDVIDVKGVTHGAKTIL